MEEFGDYRTQADIALNSPIASTFKWTKLTLQEMVHRPDSAEILEVASPLDSRWDDVVVLQRPLSGVLDQAGCIQRPLRKTFLDFVGGGALEELRDLDYRLVE